MLKGYMPTSAPTCFWEEHSPSSAISAQGGALSSTGPDSSLEVNDSLSGKGSAMVPAVWNLSSPGQINVFSGAHDFQIGHLAVNIGGGPTSHGDILRSLSNDLGPSHRADYKYHPRGSADEPLSRDTCTPGTRTRILENIEEWANDTTPMSHDIFWLFGPAGSGKTTIANTIARHFGFRNGPTDKIVLGGSFMCSRQFPETRTKELIVPTIAYQLARACPGFAEVLSHSPTSDIFMHSVETQLQDLLVIPWKNYQSSLGQTPASTQPFLVVIDALDEIQEQGGSLFLHDLLDVIDAHPLPGLKFFVTSRPEQELVDQIDSFHRKQLLKLQDVEEEEARRDVATYLHVSLPALKGRPEMKAIEDFAGGLFIGAATIVRHLTRRGIRRVDQEREIRRLIPHNTVNCSAGGAIRLLDALYRQILLEALGQFDAESRDGALAVLHTFLCTAERTSTDLVAKILAGSTPLGPDADTDLSLAIANDVLTALHAVLYVDSENNVLSYHKSFPDFIFTPERSQEFSCDPASHHELLTEQCFRIMDATLRFNIANIPSSFLMNRDNKALEADLERNITPELSYSCRNWQRHLGVTPDRASHPFLEWLASFLQLRVLFWIEAMNLFGCCGQCDGDLRKAGQWVGQHDRDLALMLKQAAAFALFFSASPASESAPHLYISALATWPRGDGPALKWREHFPRIPDFQTRGSRQNALMTIDVGSSVYTAVFSPDGAQIVSGSADHSVRVWDASTGKQLKVLEGHASSVWSVAFSPDGGCIVSGSQDKSVRVWDAATGKQLKMLEGHTDAVWSVVFSPDGARIVSGSGDNLVRVWDASTGEQLKVLEGHTDTVESVAFSPDGGWIVSGSRDKSVRVWDASTGRQLKVLEGHTDKVVSVAFSPEGARIVSGSGDHSLRVWDASTGTQLKALGGHTDIVASVAFSPDGGWVVSSSVDTSVRVWDASTGEQLKLLEGHTATVVSVAFSPDGAWIVSASQDKSVWVWDASTEAQLMVLEGHTDPVMSVAFSPDGGRIVSGSTDNSLRVWDASTGRQLKVLEGHTGTVWSVAFSPDGARIVSGSVDRLVRVWDVFTGKQLIGLEGHTSSVWSVAFSPDGGRIASGSVDKSVRVWDAFTGKQLMVLEGHSGTVWSLAWSPDGAWIVSGSGGNSVRVWDASTGQQLKMLEGHTSSVWSVAFSHDGGRIVSGSVDNSVRVWDAFTGKQLAVMEGHTDTVVSVAFSPDRAWIVSGAGAPDNSVRVWDALTGKQLRVLEGHTVTVFSVALSPDGAWIVSGSGDPDNSVRVWDASMLGNTPAAHQLESAVLPASSLGEQVPQDSYTTTVTTAISKENPPPAMFFPSFTSLEMLDAHTMRMEIELAEWKRHRNSHLPIAKLPEEILCNIFGKASKARRLPMPFGVTVGQVCYRWRVLIYGSPLLWADIQVRSDTKFQLLNHVFKNSKGVPISLAINIPEAKSQPTLELLGETVQTEATRIRALSVIGDEYTHSQVFKGPFKDPHSRMETFEVTGMDGSAMIFNTGLQFISAPNIRRIRLGHLARGATVVVPWKFTLFAKCANLTHLRATHTPEAGSFRDIKELLRTAPQLQELSLLFDNPYSRPFALGESTGAQKPPKLNRIRMPCLRVLHLESRREWTPAAVLLDGMQLDMESLETFSLIPRDRSSMSGITVERWWSALRNSSTSGWTCAPEVLHLSSGELRIEAWREVRDATEESSLPWVLGGEDAVSYGHRATQSVELLAQGAPENRWESRKVSPWISLDVPPYTFFDPFSYRDVWSFSNLKVLEFGTDLTGDLWETIEREALHLEAIVIKSVCACGLSYAAFQELLKARTGCPFGELKRLSLQGPREPRNSVSVRGGLGRRRCWPRRREREGLFRLPQKYCAAERRHQLISQVDARLTSLAQLIRCITWGDVHEEEGDLEEQGDFMLDFTDILWERKQRGVLEVANAVGGRDLTLDTLEFVGIKQDGHEEVKKMILDSGVAREVDFL